MRNQYCYYPVLLILCELRGRLQLHSWEGFSVCHAQLRRAGIYSEGTSAGNLEETITLTSQSEDEPLKLQKRGLKIKVVRSDKGLTVQDFLYTPVHLAATGVIPKQNGERDCRSQ